MLPDYHRQPPYQPFPVNSLPSSAREFVGETANAIGCDTAYVALPVLSVLAAAIGNSRKIELKSSWLEPSCVWTCIVGENWKSPAVERALGPVYNLETNTALKIIASSLKKKPKGLLLCCDDLSALLGRISHHEHWMTVFSGNPLVIDRKPGNQRYIHIPRALVSICGGIQPSVLRRAINAKYRMNPLVYRMLIACPPSRPGQWTDDAISEDTAQLYCESVSRLYALKMGARKDELVPLPIRLSPAAKEAFRQFVDENGAEQCELTDDLAAVWSKLKAYVARLALIFFLVRQVTGQTEESAVGSEDIAAAVTVVRWFGNEARRIYAGETENEFYRRNMAIIRQNLMEDMSGVMNQNKKNGTSLCDMNNQGAN